MIPDDPFFRSVLQDFNRQMNAFFSDDPFMSSNNDRTNRHDPVRRIMNDADHFPIGGIFESFFGSPFRHHRQHEPYESTLYESSGVHNLKPRNLMFKNNSRESPNKPPEPIIEFPSDDEDEDPQPSPTRYYDRENSNTIVKNDNQRRNNSLNGWSSIFGPLSNGYDQSSENPNQGYFKSYSYSYSYTGGLNGRVRERTVYKDSTGREEINERDEELPNAQSQNPAHYYRSLPSAAQSSNVWPRIEELPSASNSQRSSSSSQDRENVEKFNSGGGILSKIKSFFKI